MESDEIYTIHDNNSEMEEFETDEMLRPQIVTANASGFNLLPPHETQSIAVM